MHNKTLYYWLVKLHVQNNIKYLNNMFWPKWSCSDSVHIWSSDIITHDTFKYSCKTYDEFYWINQCKRNNPGQNYFQYNNNEYKETKILADDMVTLALFAEIYLQYPGHN